MASCARGKEEMVHCCNPSVVDQSIESYISCHLADHPGYIPLVSNIQPVVAVAWMFDCRFTSAATGHLRSSGKISLSKDFTNPLAGSRDDYGFNMS